MKEGKLGVAVVGLGMYSEGQLAYALQKTSHCKLAGIASGSPHKVDMWKRKFNLREDAC